MTVPISLYQGRARIRRALRRRTGALCRPARRLHHRGGDRRAHGRLHRRDPRAQGYLKRLREICDKYNILLIFDEVITGFGRLGFAFAAERYGVIPDMITFAKGITSGAVPMGGVLVRSGIHDAFMKGPEHVIELFHGYTYSAIRSPAPPRWRRWMSMPMKTCSNRARALEPMWADA